MTLKNSTSPGTPQYFEMVSCDYGFDEMTTKVYSIVDTI